MTKKKTSIFKGAWIDETVPERDLLKRIQAEPGDIDPTPIIAEVARQSGNWKFREASIEEEPEPAEWPGLVGKIVVGSNSSVIQLLEAKAQISRTIPSLMLSKMDLYVFQQFSFGWCTLFDQAIEGTDTQYLDAIQRMLKDFSSIRLRGKRGPRKTSLNPLGAVTDVIMLNPGMSYERARPLAADLLKLAGVKAPEGRSQQIKKISSKGKLSDR